MGWWPHLKTALIGLHVFAVVVLSLPNAQSLLQRRNWELPSTQRAFSAIADRLNWLGVDSTKDFEDKLWRFTERAVQVRDAVAKPFRYYTRLAGVREGWRMFSRPREHPMALEIAIDESNGFRPIYRPHSDKYDWWAPKLGQYRMRAVTGQLARKFDAGWYNTFAKLLATRAAQAYPNARRVRVRTYQWTTPTPAEVRAGHQPKGRHKHYRFYRADALR